MIVNDISCGNNTPDKKIRIAGYSKLSEQCYALSKLYADRILSDSDYFSKLNPIQSEMNRLRTERNNLFKLDKDEDCLTQLIELNELVKNISDPYAFDEDFFDEAVEKITIDDDKNITFRIIGGLNITERGTA